MSRIASTTRSAGETEVKTLNADAGATSLSLSAGLTNAHGGTAPVQAEVSCLTRTVGIRGVTATKNTFVVLMGSVTVTVSWALLKNAGPSTADKHGFTLSHTGGTVSVTALVIRSGASGFQLGTTSGTAGAAFTLTNCVTFDLSSSCLHIYQMRSASISGTTIYGNNLGEIGIAWDSDLSPTWATWTDTRICSVQDGMRSLALGVHAQGQVITNLTIHSCSRFGINFNTAYSSLVIDGLTIYRTNNFGFYVNSPIYNILVKTVAIFGCNDTSVYFETSATAAMGLMFLSGTLSGDTTFASVRGIFFSDVSVVQGIFRNLDFGASSGIFANHATADISMGAGYANAIFDKATLRSTTELTFRNGQSGIQGASTLRFQRYDGTTGVHRTYARTGTVAYDTGTVDVSPSIKMTPLSAIEKLDTAAGIPGSGFYVPVDNGSTPTVSIKVQKDGSYNGNPPRLILKANASLGILADTVIDTFSGGSGSFQTLSGTAPAAADAGMMEFVVDCDGTAGSVYVDTLSVIGGSVKAPGGMDFFVAGLPVAIVSNSSGGAGTVETSYPFGG